LRSSWYRAIPGALVAGVLVAIAAWSAWRVAMAGRGVPGDDQWKKASAAVRARFWKDDLIVFAPSWIDPVGRLHLGDLIPVDRAARMDGARYGTIWELSIRGARAPETRGMKSEWRGDFGGLTVRRFVQTPADIATDFIAAAGTVKTVGAVARGPAVEVAEVGFAPRRCVQVVPEPGQSVTMTWPDVELGRELVGYVGLADVFTRRDVRAPGALAVRIGDHQVVGVEVGVDDGWVRFAAPTTPGRAAVTFVASAPARDRLICFAAEARR
jgi:hypothetical protein